MAWVFVDYVWKKWCMCILIFRMLMAQAWLLVIIVVCYVYKCRAFHYWNKIYHKYSIIFVQLVWNVYICVYDEARQKWHDWKILYAPWVRKSFQCNWISSGESGKDRVKRVEVGKGTKMCNIWIELRRAPIAFRSHYEQVDSYETMCVCIQWTENINV